MNHILIRFLIKIILFKVACNFVLCSNLDKWLFDKNNFFKNEMVEVSFTANFQSNQFPAYIDNVTLLFNTQKNVYQVKFMDAIVYYDGKKINQYNFQSNQMFINKPDKIINSLIRKVFSAKLFNFKNYKLINSGSYLYLENLLNSDSLIISYGTKDTIKYISNHNKYFLYDIKFDVLDSTMFKNKLFYNIVDTLTIDIFDFTS